MTEDIIEVKKDRIFLSLKNMEQRINFSAFVVMLLVLEELHCKCLISIKETQQTKESKSSIFSSKKKGAKFSM